MKFNLMKSLYSIEHSPSLIHALYFATQFKLFALIVCHAYMKQLLANLKRQV